MISAFAVSDGLLEQRPVAGPDDLGEAIVWIDLVDPTAEERQWVEQAYAQSLPTAEEIAEIEASARFFEDEEGLHLNSYFLYEDDGRYSNINVGFALGDGRLYTLHERDLPTFRMFRMRARRQAELATSASQILLRLLETTVEQLADELEAVYTNLEAVSQTVLSESGRDMRDALAQLATQEDLTGKIRLSLMDKQRVLSFLSRRNLLDVELREELRDILRDVESLLSHTAFLFEKVNFLMDAAMGFINIEQNQIIKIFSIAAVVFLPPTMIASIYGMNFEHMPELDWTWGYPAAIALMVLSGIAPYLFFRYKGWL
ncbi:MAG: magnesium/cobalt transporter CorA [Halofilum sp. (in: g-proteobacteria)]|nr:magnesium/cobalt transporter CorA [Halofilum sp. (in: g-proteobacteria)]